MAREGWKDTAGGFRRCRLALAAVVPQFSPALLCAALELDPAWYSRIERGQQGVGIETFARLAKVYLGMLRAFGGLLTPALPASLHALLPEAAAPDPLPPPPNAPAAPVFQWRIAGLRAELGRARGQQRPLTTAQLTAALRGVGGPGEAERRVNLDRIAAIESGQSQGSIPTLLALHAYAAAHLPRPYTLDELLVITPEIPTNLIVRMEQATRHHAAGASRRAAIR